jgi:hypothetical protein
MPFDGIEALTPSPQGDATLEEIKEHIGDKILLDGIPAIYFMASAGLPDGCVERCAAVPPAPGARLWTRCRRAPKRPTPHDAALRIGGVIADHVARHAKRQSAATRSPDRRHEERPGIAAEWGRVIGHIFEPPRRWAQWTATAPALHGGGISARPGVGVGQARVGAYP